EAAREMVGHNDWVTLKINGGFRYLEKAPLMFWLVAASYKIFGVHDWSARLPIALGMLALLLVVYRIGRRFYGDEGGLYAALALGTGFGPFIYTRFMIPEMLVGLGGNHGTQRPDQRPDRPGLSHWNDFSLSSAHEESPPPSPATPGFKLFGLSGDCSSVACACRLAQSGARRDRKIFLVLLC